MMLPVLSLCAAAMTTEAQSSTIPDWQIAAGGKMDFDVASVKQNKSGQFPAGDPPKTNVLLGPGDIYSPNGGLLSATNYPLTNYIQVVPVSANA